MRSLMIYAAVLALSGSTATLSAQGIKQPGQLRTALQIQVGTPDSGTNSSSAVPRTTIAEVQTPHDTFINRLWIASIAASIAGTSLDAATSWGKREGNGLLASSNGQFGARGLSIKAGVEAAVIVPQILLRKHRNLKGAFAMGNFGEAAIFSGVAVHNLQVRSAASQ